MMTQNTVTPRQYNVTTETHFAPILFACKHNSYLRVQVQENGELLPSSFNVNLIEHKRWSDLQLIIYQPVCTMGQTVKHQTV